MRNTNAIATLIVAAGESSRMGRPKQLLPWKHTTLLGNAIETAQTISKDAVHVVLGANYEKILKTVSSKSAKFIFNPNYKSGLGSSIAHGVDYILKTDKKYEAIVLLLGDQPLLDSPYLDQIVETYKKNAIGIVATDYGHRAGVPALFDKKFFGRLSSLNEDYGAMEIIKKNAEEVLKLNPEGKAVDVDTIEDYEALIRSIS